MGLMLSVIVFCVGIAEALDCWHHFLLHLVQPQYHPLPYHLDPKTDVLSERELCPPSDPRRPSHVDISWPKDLTPGDDLHVIKRRSHSESERNFEHDEVSGHRPVERRGSHERETEPSGRGHSETKICNPHIVVHSPDTDNLTFQDSPGTSRDNSPNHLELSVIIESDSSSEVDEPSQIENLAYKKRITESADTHERQIETTSDETQELVNISKHIDTDFGKSCNYEALIPRPSCPSSLRFEVSENGSTSPPSNLIGSSTSDLPVFTDNILSGDVMRVSGRYPTDGNVERDSSTSKFEEKVVADGSIYENVSNNSNSVVPEFSGHSETKVLVIDETRTDTSTNNNQSIATILDEGLEPIPEFPEIRVSESSPVPVDSSDSSLNTSDASWIAKSKTSDRPLVIRFSSSPDDGRKEFMSVTKTDLQALGSNDSTGESDKEGDDKEVFYDATGNTEIPHVAVIDVNKTETSVKQQLEQGSSNPVEIVPDVASDSHIVDERNVFETESKISSANQVQPDTTSSSSSLSGIPQLPEDAKDSLFCTSLPTDNGFGNENLETFGGPVLGTTAPNDTLEQSKSFKLSDTTRNDDADVILDPVTGNITPTEIKDKVTNKKDKLKTEDPKERVDKEGTSKASTTEKFHEEKTTLQSKDSPLMASLESGSEPQIPHDDFNKKEVSKSPLDSPNLTPSEEKGSKTSSKTPVREKSTKKQKPKASLKQPAAAASTESENVVLLCQAKESDEEDHVDNRAKTISVESSPISPATSEDKRSKPDEPVRSTPGPSTSINRDAAEASTSKGNNPEDKAFWLIFSGEYTKAMNKDWHSGHFCCWQCDESLTGQRYVLRDEHPYCIKCYESVFANGCEECNKTIGIDSKDLSYKDKHWHEACFLCNKCRVSLVDKQFGSKLDKIFCGNCYDAQFASRCDGCGQIFKAGTKKMEYKTRQWHEPCFACCVCKSPIGTKSFIPREQEIYCATCYEEKFATRCVKCNKIITSGGVTYKNEPWHRECFTCTNCSTSLAGQRFTSRDEKPYCADCFGELFAKRCTACCKPITGIGGTRFISFEDRHWHNDCFICASCKTSLVGRGFITDGDDIICPECAKQKLM